jgi:hypothetical protein
MIETADPHQYGDFAVTKYYQPSEDIGLGNNWQGIQEMISGDPTLVESPILGTPLGPEGNRFDPGKMGSYFQSPQQVRQNLHYLVRLTKQTNAELSEAVEMLRQAADAKEGLYVTF